MSETMARKPADLHPGDLSEFDLDILGRSAVRLNIPVQDRQDTLNELRKVFRVTERAIYILENSQDKDRTALFQVKSLLRGCAMSIARVKRRRF